MNESCTELMAAIIPSLNPDKRFSSVIASLAEAGFVHIVIVDDGSDEAHQHFFEEAARFPAVTVLHHKGNKGKGRALKTAFSYVLENLPEVRGVITADGDGQHLTEDIIACGEKLLAEPDKVIIGCRNFKRKDIPRRNRFGNRFTSAMFLLFFGIRLSDTQTGLRAIPASLLERFCGIEGERFEYETNMLLVMKREKIDFLEQPIATVYDEENYSTHYNPLKDSWRIFKVMAKHMMTMIKFALSSLVATVIDLSVFYFVFRALVGPEAGYAELAATVVARVVSSFVNFNLNKSTVFGKEGSYRKTLLRYYCVAVPQMLLSALFVTLINDLLGNALPIYTTLIKICVDAVLFFASYKLQKSWVFKKEEA